jgi:2-dehydro-3-deoxyphosphogluconate aldolase/(4S)-4-hydroxy-2-oxoglutarate aldolase
MSGRFRFERVARIVDRGVVAIVRESDPGTAESVARRILDAGLDVVEVSLTTPGAFGCIERLTASYPDALIGAGTVLDDTTARLALLAGARFLVSPTLDIRALRVAHRSGAPMVAGVQTPTEVERALSAGADLLKLYPASTLGVEHLRALVTVFPQAPLLPTGGVGVENADVWLGAGAVALGIGAGLSSAREDIRATVGSLLAAVDASRAAPPACD